MGANEFGTLLRQHRVAAGLTQEQLAELAGVSARAVGRLEGEPHRTPRHATVGLLATALGLSGRTRVQFLAAARPSAPSFRGSRTRADLPKPLTPLLGRDGVLQAVTLLVLRGEYRLITLTGPGGVGKTRLALSLGASLADDFTDGVVYVDLAPLRDPALVVSAIAERLGVEERGQGALSERLAAALHDEQLLLVLDNFEHLLPASEVVVDLLERCPQLIVLTTSRSPLRARGEREYRVAPLEVPLEGVAIGDGPLAPAVALFGERSRAAGVELGADDHTLSAIAAICRRLDGLPLGIELAAAWTRLLTPMELLSRLDRRLQVLVDGPADLPVRQRTMRETIAWSYELLSESQQRLFRQLAVCAGGCSIDAVEAISLPRVDSLGTFAEIALLVERSLLRREEGTFVLASRVTFLETIREFGQERLQESGEFEAASDRHAYHFLSLAEDAASGLRGPDGAAWRARLTIDHENLRAALAWLLRDRDAISAVRLASALAPFWCEQGYLTEGSRWLAEALVASADQLGSMPDLQARAVTGAAMLAIEQSNHDTAVGLCAQAVELARSPAAAANLPRALNLRGLLARAQGQYSAAASDHEEANKLAVGLGDQREAATALNGLATALTFTGDPARARSLALESATISRALGDERGLAESLLTMIWLATLGVGVEHIAATSGEAVGLLRNLGDTGRLAEALFALGIAAQFGGRLDEATQLHHESLALRNARGDERGTVEPRAALAWIALLSDDAEESRSLLVEALEILSRYDDPWNRAMCLVLLAHVELSEGQAQTARPYLGEGAAIYLATGNLLYVPWCLEGLAAVAAAHEDWEGAARFCGARDALHARMGSHLPPC